MTLLLDTHVLVWLVVSPHRMSDDARTALADEDAIAYATHVSIWEITINRGLGRMSDVDCPASSWFDTFVPASNLRQLTIAPQHLGAVEHLPMHHRDPFDRLLVRQALSEGMALVSADGALARYEGVDVVW